MVHISLKVQVMFKNGHFKNFQNLVLLFIAGLKAPNKSKYAHYIIINNHLFMYKIPSI